ncbi:bifunctional 4-hydroxy-2-oxoglutarate aldolase/2-dehydro-3-deoxy-phosphogluconate aldolase [Arcobacter sp. HD9-500m-PIT-SAG02]|nr:bifunctional 4-hydroxy-2-oxoglutarate aldolase/2-dehydro-3-deoxy-phosphogluconate aldolase [Arcobacter sp. HD9-500m-PIT-SAG02]
MYKGAIMPKKKTHKVIQQFENSPVIPIVTFKEINSSLKIAEILIKEGLTNLEVTLRAPNALTCIEAIAKEFPVANVGAGTIIRKEQLQQIKDVGWTFAVSPGFTKTMVEEARRIEMPYLPGPSTPSEIIELLELGVTFQKFFHAGNSGGYKMLEAYSNIFSEVKFCTTGGIGALDFTDYLKLDNVLCLGGSWMLPFKDVEMKVMIVSKIQLI